MSDLPQLAGALRPQPGGALQPRSFPVPTLLQEAADAVAALDPQDPMAVVAYSDGQTQAGFAVVARLGEKWTFVGKLNKPWDGRLDYGVSVVWKPFR